MPAKTPISLRIQTIVSKSLVGAFWTAKDAEFLHLDIKYCDQFVRVRRLVFSWPFKNLPVMMLSKARTVNTTTETKCQGQA